MWIMGQHYGSDQPSSTEHDMDEYDSYCDMCSRVVHVSELAEVNEPAGALYMCGACMERVN